METETKTIDQLDAFLRMETSGGKIFTVTFIKKDGSERVMNARFGVTKHLTGKGMNYVPKAKKLVPVFDMQKRGYRMVCLDTVTNLKIGGEVFKVI